MKIDVSFEIEDTKVNEVILYSSFYMNISFQEEGLDEATVLKHTLESYKKGDYYEDDFHGRVNFLERCIDTLKRKDMLKSIAQSKVRKHLDYKRRKIEELESEMNQYILEIENEGFEIDLETN